MSNVRAILHCLRAPVGGLFRHVRDLAAEQARSGHRVGVVCDATGGDPLTEARLAELAPYLALGLHRVGMSRELGPADWHAFRSIRSLTRALGVEVLHGHGAKGGAYARLVAKSLRRAPTPPVAIYTPHGGSLHYEGTSLVGRAYLGLERLLAAATDAIVFESAYAARLYAARVTDRVAVTRVVPNGLTTLDLVAVPPQSGAADLVYVGELRHIKGIDVLLHAVASLAPVREVSAVLVGAGPDRAELEALASRLGLGYRVRFAGAMPARQAFALGRVLVVPSRAESFPYVVLEGAGAHLPLIATDVGGIPEIIAGTDTSLVPPENVEALAAHIIRTLERPGAARAGADRLAARVAERFTVEAMTDDILKLYARALDRRASAAACRGGVASVAAAGSPRR